MTIGIYKTGFKSELPEIWEDVVWVNHLERCLHIETKDSVYYYPYANFSYFEIMDKETKKENKCEEELIDFTKEISRDDQIKQMANDMVTYANTELNSSTFDDSSIALISGFISKYAENIIKRIINR